MPRAPRYFLPWHFEFLCRWRPMDDACEELTALSRHTPLMQSGREVDALLATIEVARERGGRSRRWALVAVGAPVAVDGVRRAKREWRAASRVCAPLCVLRSLSAREQSAPASPFLRDHTRQRLAEGPRAELDPLERLLRIDNSELFPFIASALWDAPSDADAVAALRRLAAQTPTALDDWERPARDLTRAVGTGASAVSYG